MQPRLHGIERLLILNGEWAIGPPVTYRSSAPEKREISQAKNTLCGGSMPQKN